MPSIDMNVVYATLHRIWIGVRGCFVKAGNADEVTRRDEAQIQWIPAPDADLVAKTDENKEFREKIASRAREIRELHTGHPPVVFAMSHYPIFSEILRHLDMKSLVELSFSNLELMRYIQYDWILAHVVTRTRMVFETKYMDEGRQYIAKHELIPVFCRVTRDQRHTPLGQLVYELKDRRTPPSFRRGEYHPHSITLFLDDESRPWRWESRPSHSTHNVRRGRLGTNPFDEPMELIREVFYKFPEFRCTAEGIHRSVTAQVFYYQRDRRIRKVNFHAASIPYKFFLELLLDGPPRRT
jgi:hypothetical protein